MYKILQEQQGEEIEVGSIAISHHHDYIHYRCVRKVQKETEMMLA
jgi:hypothetical protein